MTYLEKYSFSAYLDFFDYFDYEEKMYPAIQISSHHQAPDIHNTNTNELQQPLAKVKQAPPAFYAFRLYKKDHDPIVSMDLPCFAAIYFTCAYLYSTESLVLTKRNQDCP